MKAATAAEQLILEVASAQTDFDRRSGQLIVKIELKEKRPFTRLVAEQQVARTMQLRVNGEVILSGVIREPLYAGVIEISGPAISEAQGAHRTGK